MEAECAFETSATLPTSTRCKHARDEPTTSTMNYRESIKYVIPHYFIFKYNKTVMVLRDIRDKTVR
jgi:hypothetical protein